MGPAMVRTGGSMHDPCQAALQQVNRGACSDGPACGRRDAGRDNAIQADSAWARSAAGSIRGLGPEVRRRSQVALAGEFGFVGASHCDVGGHAALPPRACGCGAEHAPAVAPRRARCLRGVRYAAIARHKARLAAGVLRCRARPAQAPPSRACSVVPGLPGTGFSSSMAHRDRRPAIASTKRRKRRSAKTTRTNPRVFCSAGLARHGVFGCDGHRRGLIAVLDVPLPVCVRGVRSNIGAPSASTRGSPCPVRRGFCVSL
jgi:hypothetical protein